LQVAKRLLVISIGILVIMGYVYFVNFFVDEWRSLDKEFRDYIPSAALSGIGLFLLAIRNVKGANKFLLDAMGLLILASVPAISRA